MLTFPSMELVSPLTNGPAPLVSVVIIVYNGEAYVGTAIESVLAQSFADFELIVVDDGSTDGTRAVVARYEALDPRVRVVHRTNGGLSAARNSGITASQGTWLAFLDCDDWWTPEKLERQVSALRAAPDLRWIYSAARIVDETGAPVSEVPAVHQGDVFDAMIFGNVVAGSASSVMIHRQAMQSAGYFDESCRFAEDWECWVRLAAHYPIGAVPNVDVFLLHRRGSHSKRVLALRDATLKILSRNLRLRSVSWGARRAAHARIHYTAAINWAETGRPWRAIPSLLHTIGWRPTFVPAYKRLVLTLLGRVA